MQKHKAFDLDADFDWDRELDFSKPFLPLDEDSIAFPGATLEQRVVLSQLMGLIINHTISEMEEVANRLKHIAWRKVLDDFPVNPEMVSLGEQFFDEEAKHAEMFRRFHDKFCHEQSIDPQSLARLMPQAYGSYFQAAVRKNAEAGGHAFWWVVALVEEVSVAIYHQMYKSRKELDPVFYQVHRRHFEEESRHTNYAFLMLEIIKRRNQSVKQKIHQKLDLVYSEFFATGWVVTELEKVFSAKKLRKEHPFFEQVADCIPLFKKMGSVELAKRLFVSAPYISTVLNPKYHKLTTLTAKDHAAMMWPYPTPCPSVTYASREMIWNPA